MADPLFQGHHMFFGPEERLLPPVPPAARTLFLSLLQIKN
jgi:hypothetical protein